MSLQMKLIIPLLDKEITKEDLSPEAGFIDAYSYDINRPAIENCIFLMYDADSRTDEANRRYGKFEKLSTLRSSKVIYVDKKAYIVYAFVIIDTDIKNLLKGVRHTKNASYLRFVQFWGTGDGVVNHYLLVPTTCFNYEARSVPEEDYRPTLDELWAIQKERRVP
jgi:hypothetical protein